jgi:pimeloyl-ACP methyl ester carboxylesterase
VPIGLPTLRLMQAARSDSFLHRGQRLTFSEYGSGERVCVLLPGLLLPRRMQDPLARRLAGRGSRVLTLDLLGHGDSDRPEDSWHYSMSRFADQAVALLDHLEMVRAAIGGTSLGANVALEAGARHPDRAAALILEMPVLDDSQLAASTVFTPLGLALRFGALPLRPLSRLARLLPRGAAGSGHFANLVDTGLDWVSQDPRHASTVLVGLAYGRTAPPREEREKLEMPILIIAHEGDPIHALADSKTASRDLPNAELVRARTFFEMRFAPGRLSDEVADFLERRWDTGVEVAAASR